MWDIVPPDRCCDKVTGMVAVVSRFGNTLRKTMGLFVAVLTPLMGPVQVKRTLASNGVGVWKNTEMF
jgi:hypothetical protein